MLDFLFRGFVSHFFHLPVPLLRGGNRKFPFLGWKTFYPRDGKMSFPGMEKFLSQGLEKFPAIAEGGQSCFFHESAIFSMVFWLM